MKNRVFVIVSGGRHYQDYTKVEDTLNKIDDLYLVIQGGASGADQLARRYCKENGVQCVTFHANWEYHERAAGPLRNEAMIYTFQRSRLILFPGGDGTADAKRWAEKLSMDILEVDS